MLFPLRELESLIARRCFLAPSELQDTFVEVDLDKTWKLPEDSPLGARVVSGCVRRVVLRGQTAFVDGKLAQGEGVDVLPTPQPQPARQQVGFPSALMANSHAAAAPVHAEEHHHHHDLPMASPHVGASKLPLFGATPMIGSVPQVCVCVFVFVCVFHRRWAWYRAAISSASLVFDCATSKALHFALVRPLVLHGNTQLTSLSSCPPLSTAHRARRRACPRCCPRPRTCRPCRPTRTPRPRATSCPSSSLTATACTSMSLYRFPLDVRASLLPLRGFSPFFTCASSRSGSIGRRQRGMILPLVPSTRCWLSVGAALD